MNFVLSKFNKDVFFMKKALEMAECAYEQEEVPIGCVIVYKDKIIAKAYNQVEKLQDSTAHAEMIAITQGQMYLKSKWLKECVLYVTIEPCLMCAHALILSRIKGVFFGTYEPKWGAFGSVININALNLNHRIKVKSGILKSESRALIKNFFESKRHNALDSR